MTSRSVRIEEKRLHAALLVIIAAVACSAGMLAFSVPRAEAAIAFKRVTTNAPSSWTANVSTANVTQTAGDLVVLKVDWGWDGPTVSSITDTLGDVFTSTGPALVGYASNYTENWDQQVFYAKNVPGGTDTITINFSAQPNAYVEIYLNEYSGADTSSPFDQIATTTGTGTTIATPCKTTTVANEAIIGFMTDAIETPTAGTGFTEEAGYFNNNVDEDKIVSSTGCYSATASQPSATDDYEMTMVTFKAAGGAPTTFLSTGADPSASTVAPSSTNVFKDQFQLSDSAGTDSVTGLTVTTANTSAIASLSVMNDAMTTQYFTTSSVPSGNTWSFSGGTPIPVGTATTTYRIIMTAKSYAALTAGTYPVTAYVSAVTSTNAKSGSDTDAPATTIDRQAPGNATWGSNTAGNTQVVLNWTNPGDGDFNSEVILRNTALVSNFPVDGQTYVAGNTIGTSTVVYAGAATTFTDTGLSNGTSYYYKIFPRDTYINYNAGVGAGPYTPAPAALTFLTTGSDPANSTIAPSSTNVYADQFQFNTSAGTDSITNLTVTTTGTPALASVSIVNNAMTQQYFATTTVPAGNTWSFSGGTPIPVGTATTTYRIIMTAKSYAALTAGTYPVSAYVSSYTSTNGQSWWDTAGTTTTVDRQAPGNATWGSNTAGNTQVVLNWTNPGDGDFNSEVILRNTALVSNFPVDGQTYVAGNTIGTSTVVYAGAATTFTDTGLSNGTSYYYKIFPRDTYINYNAGVGAGPYTPAAAAATLTIGVTTGSLVTTSTSGLSVVALAPTSCAASSTCPAFTLSISSSSDTVTSIKVTENGTVSGADLGNLSLWYNTTGNANGATTQYGSTVASFTGQTATVVGSLAVAFGNTYYFYVKTDLKSSTPTYPVGGQTVDFQVAANADVTVSGSSVKSGAPTSLSGVLTVLPDVATTTYPTAPDGGASNQTATLTGYGFGTVAAGASRANCAGGTGTGCIRFLIGGAATVGYPDITAWTNTSISFTVSTTLATLGGVNTLQVTAASQSDPNPWTFYAYPNITNLVSLQPFAAREYNAVDTDGLIYLSGDHFGSATGTVQFTGAFGTVASTIHPTAGGSCAVAGWASTTVQSSTACVEVPANLPTSTYSGTITLTRSGDSKAYVWGAGFQVLPRLLSMNPSTGSAGTAIDLLGDHLCSSGGCPVSPNRSTAANHVTFGSQQSLDSDFVTPPTGSTTVTSASLTTSGANRLLLATVALQNSTSQTVNSISGGGLTWVFVASSTNGTSARVEVWRAFASTTFSGAVTATLSASAKATILVAAYNTTNTGGSNGSGAIGAVTAATGSGAAPSLTLTTTVSNALVVSGLAVQSLPTVAAGAGQTLEGSAMVTSGGAAATNVTGAGEAENGLTSNPGAVISNYTLGSANSWAMVGVEIKP